MIKDLKRQQSRNNYGGPKILPAARIHVKYYELFQCKIKNFKVRQTVQIQSVVRVATYSPIRTPQVATDKNLTLYHHKDLGIDWRGARWLTKSRTRPAKKLQGLVQRPQYQQNFLFFPL